MKGFSLFSGIGGFDLGMQRNGIELVGACEIDQYARRVYERHFPGVKIYENATKIDPKEIPGHDILCAGFPCQSFSIAGNRGGFDDTRGTLFFEVARIAKEKQPSVLLLENVRGLLSHDQGQTFTTMLATLDEIGYHDLSWYILNSKYFGVPQNRERVFIVGHLGERRSREILPFGESSQDNDKEGQVQNSSTITATYYKGTGAGRPVVAEPEMKHRNVTEHNGSRVYDTDGISPTLMAGEGTGSRVKIDEPKIKKIGGLKSESSQKGSVYSSDGITPTLVAGPHGYVNGFYTDKTKMILTANQNSNMKNRVQDREETWCLTNNSNDQGIIEPGPVQYRIRKLTPKECERLQGFPDDWTQGHSDTQRYKMCGNAVTVNVAEYLIGEIIK